MMEIVIANDECQGFKITNRRFLPLSEIKNRFSTKWLRIIRFLLLRKLSIENLTDDEVA
jgi:hypothetical protein